MKKIFYYTDVLPFLSKGRAATEKLKRNLDIFKDAAGEIRLVWHPYSRTVEYMRLNSSAVTEEYLAILDGFKKEGWGELDETATLKESREVMLSCAAFYGDPCDLAYDAKEAGLPVMLQNIDV